jgi:DNA-binding transcriptional LysR family regulator
MATTPELRLADLLTLLAVQRSGTISGASRELGVTPSQVSKAITRIERFYGVRLLSRGPRGVIPTPAARRMLPRIARAIEQIRATDGSHGDRDPELELTVAGPSYVLSYVLSTVANLLPRARVRGLELAPAYLRAYVAEDVFDVALAPGGMQSRPASWTSDPVGEVRTVLLGRPSFARRIGPMPLTVERVRALPFIGPAPVGRDRFVAVSDNCPLTPEERIVAHEVQTVGTALEFAAQEDFLVFGPKIAASRFLEEGALVEIPVSGWDVRDPLFVLCNRDRVLARVRTAVVRAAKDVLEAS